MSDGTWFPHPDLIQTVSLQAEQGTRRYVYGGSCYLLYARVTGINGAAGLAVEFFTSEDPDSTVADVNIGNLSQDSYRGHDDAPDVPFPNGIYFKVTGPTALEECLVEVAWIPRQDYCRAYHKPQCTLQACWAAACGREGDAWLENFDSGDPDTGAWDNDGAFTGSGGAGPGEFLDTIFRVQDDGDDTKELAFEVSAIDTATTRTVTWPNSDVTIHKDNLVATVGPGVGDDTADDYTVGSRWIDVTADVVYVAVDVTAGAAVWKDVSTGGGGGGLSNIVEDTTPQLGGMLDVNGQTLGDGTLELMEFTEVASAVNQVNIANAATGNAPGMKAEGDDVNVDLLLAGKGTGKVQIGSSDFDVASGDITVSGTVDGRDVATDGTKLDGIETAATADQTGAQIKTAYEAEANAFTDAQFTKLAGIETAATADQNADEVDDTWTTKKFVTADDLTVLGNTSGTNTGDEPAATTAIVGVSEHANQTEAEDGADLTKVLTPNSIANLIKALPKAFGSFDPNGSPTVDSNSFNVASITHSGTGQFVVNFTNNITTPFVCTVSVDDSTATAFWVGTAGQTTGSVNLFCRSTGGSLSNAAEGIHFVVHSYNI